MTSSVNHLGWEPCEAISLGMRGPDFCAYKDFSGWLVGSEPMGLRCIRERGPAWTGSVVQQL